MKILSLLNKKITRFIYIILVILIILGTFSILLSRENKTNFVYHQSHWNEYSPEIDRATKPEQSIFPVNLKHVYGIVVSHHIPTTIPQLVDTYSRLKKTQSIKNFIIIGPDHNSAGDTTVTVSNSTFFTIYGEVKPIDGLALKLKNTKLANIDEKPFDLEHSVGSQILIISKLFPNANITPIIIRSDIKKEHAKILGEEISKFLDKDTILVTSVDFSHYLSSDQSYPIDKISGEIIRKLDAESLSLVEVDSIGSVSIFIEAMKIKKSFDTENLTVLNTNNFMENSDYTTGYIFGFWGIK